MKKVFFTGTWSWFIFTVVMYTLFSAFLGGVIGCLVLPPESMVGVAYQEYGDEGFKCWSCESTSPYHGSYICEECRGKVCVYCGACYPSGCTRFVSGKRIDNSKNEIERLEFRQYLKDIAESNKKTFPNIFSCVCVGGVMGFVYILYFFVKDRQLYLI